jgi:phosphatidylinositol alpha-1,6-mannosyltransferase
MKNNETGILVDPKNIFEITGAIGKILNNYNAFSQNAKLWALQHDWKMIVKKYIDVIRELF